MLDLDDARAAQDAKLPRRWAGSVGDWACAIVLCLLLLVGVGAIVVGLLSGGIGGQCGGG